MNKIPDLVYNEIEELEVKCKNCRHFHINDGDYKNQFIVTVDDSNKSVDRGVCRLLPMEIFKNENDFCSLFNLEIDEE